MEHAIRSILDTHKYTVVNFRIPLIKYLEILGISIDCNIISKFQNNRDTRK